MHDEIWHLIEDFPIYSVSNFGEVINNTNQRLLIPHANTRGTAMVGLYKERGGVQFKRSIAVLVADAFLTTDKTRDFDTPIHLNGDRFNNAVYNLAWRPRWFAVKYMQQFRQGPQGFGRPIQDIKTEEIYQTSWDAATACGLLEREIVIAIMTRNYVWPTYQEFRVLG
jgi:hypothetical protein